MISIREALYHDFDVYSPYWVIHGKLKLRIPYFLDHFGIPALHNIIDLPVIIQRPHLDNLGENLATVTKDKRILQK